MKNHRGQRFGYLLVSFCWNRGLMMKDDLRSIAGFALVSLVLVTDVMSAGCRNARPPTSELYLVESHNADPILRYDILELVLQHNGIYGNNFFDVDLSAVFTSPEGVPHHVKGFFYGGDLWKIRFRPDQPGTWSYTYVFSSTQGFGRQASGKFHCLPSNEDGPIHRSPANPFRWVFASGKPFFPVGLEDCVTTLGSRLTDLQIDGEDRNHPGRTVTRDEYFAVYGQAGFNLFRFSQKNCSYSLMNDLDHYRVTESIATDNLLSSAYQHGFRVMYGFFGIHGNWTSDNRALRVLERTINTALERHVEALWAPNDQELVGKEERFIEYCIARWGVYADFWELLNERKASDEWTTRTAEYVRSVDPDRKPISTSWEKPNLAAIDINAPHWYEGESELVSDLRVQQQAARWKQAGKPVIVGEQGNSGMNWDPQSAIRMRIRAWTALFQEISLVFWNTSWSKAGMHHGRNTPGGASNIYLGPEERGYIRVLQDFASHLDADVFMTPVKVSSPTLVRAYGLASKNVGAIYLQHAAGHTTPVETAKITFDFSPIPHRQWVGEWIDPTTGKVLSRVEVPVGHITLRAPPFEVDVAFLIRPKSAAPFTHP